MHGAYYADHRTVAEGELRAAYPEVAVNVDVRATLTFLEVDLPPDEASALVRLSFVQAVFAPMADGLALLDADPGYALPDGLVTGAKYRGKTHEVVTQLALNLALATATAPLDPDRAVLDPMAGRGTTLFWAARYGLSAWGVEQDPKALADVQRHVKRQTQLLRIKHQAGHGSVGPKRKDGVGRYLEYRFEASAVRLVTGDARRLPALLGPKPFSMLVTDLPYGIQHVGRGGTRNPLSVLEACASGWAEQVASGGALVLVFNRLQPSRGALQALFEAQGLQVRPHDVAHRVSESIWRDLLVLYKP